MGTAHPRTLVFDVGALIGLERSDERIRALLELAVGRGVRVVVPAGVLAQIWRDGSRQARLGRFLKAPQVVCESLDPETARACGALCGRAKTADVVDASVVVAALKHRGTIVTSDPDDLRRLDPRVPIEGL